MVAGAVARRMTLEQAIAYLQDNELGVTPEEIRIRKRHLDPHERKRASRRAEAAESFAGASSTARRPPG